jgi:prepilin-type N-terminal cleavage/methylation domain-containing protein
MAEFKKRTSCGRAGAFTLIEIIVVVVILSIAALIAVPMMSSAADIQVRSAANRLAADLDYAKNMAITHQRQFSVVFNDSVSTANGYQIQDSTGTVITNPVSGRNFSVLFASERGINRVRISACVLDPATTPEAISFNYLGAPLVNGADLNNGQIILSADGFSLTVMVEPMTGYVTITP